MSAALRVRDLSVGLAGRRSVFQVLSHVDLDVRTGEILGLVGESGCGKSTLAVSILDLLEPPQVLQSGSVELISPDGNMQDILSLSEGQLRHLRWQTLAYIPQGSMNSLNPVLRVRQQMTDTLIQHGLTKDEAVECARNALQLVNLEPDILDRYPHELSGGMRQRVVIASAVSMQPPMIIADEPTTALDVVTQRLILQQLERVRTELGISIILISHDMGVMAQAVDRMAVMYAGRIVEVGTVRQVFDTPLHPYGQGLIGAIPGQSTERPDALPGEAPNPWAYPPGCRFHPRCRYVMDVCRKRAPTLLEHRTEHWAACYLYEMQ